MDTTLEKLDKMTEAEKLFQQFASKGAADPDNAVSNQQLFDAFVAARQPEIVEADVEEEISVQQPSGVTGGTLEEQMMAAESEIPVLDAYGSPIMPPPAQPEIDPSFQEKLIGAAEVLMTLASGATTGAGGMVRGTLEGLAEQILSGQFGTPEAAQMIYQKAMQRAGEATYMPRTPVGQEYVQETSEVLSQLPAMAPLVAETGAIRAGLAGAAQAARYGGRPSVQQMTGQMVRETGREAFDVLPSPVQTAGRTVAGAAQKGSDLVASGDRKSVV